MWKPLRLLLTDLAATLLFLLLYAASHSIVLAVSAGLVLAAAQIGASLWRGRRVDALQWVSAIVVLASGTATLITHDPLFVKLKPSIIYALVGMTMLQPGWMGRFMPPDLPSALSGLVVAFGYVWAGLMFGSATLNLVLAFSLPVVAWGTAMTIWGIASKAALFAIQYGVMRLVGRRLVGRRPPPMPAH